MIRKYEEPNLQIIMFYKGDVICSSIPDGIEDGTGTVIPGVGDGNDTSPFQ